MVNELGDKSKGNGFEVEITGIRNNRAQITWVPTVIHN